MGKVLQQGIKHCAKRRNCMLQAVSPFPTVFSKALYCTYVKQGLVWAKSQDCVIETNLMYCNKRKYLLSGNKQKANLL